jgi:RimJ/RimL family protein N-acetyltransferase
MSVPRERATVAEQVRLRPFRRTDLPRVIRWRRDEELRRGALWSDAPFGAREAQRWLRSVTDSVDPSRQTFAIELKESGRLVGLTNLTRIDRRGGTAYFGVVIGEKDCWGRGIAREALRLVRRTAAALRLRKVLLEVAGDNPRAIALYQRAGFATEGVLRRQIPRGQDFVDVLIMAAFLA